MKKINRIFAIGIIIMIVFSNLNVVNASGIFGKAKDFLTTGKNHPGMTTSNIFNILNNNSKTKFATVIDLLWGIGLLTIFISTVILGIRYMFANPNEKSRIKQATAPYVVGVIIIFGSVTIWRLVIVIFDGSL